MSPAVGQTTKTLRQEAGPCPSCDAQNLTVFYEVMNVPVHSVLLMPTREVAKNFRRGDLVLGFCPSCGFATNLAFDSTAHSYSAQYEETQGYSPTFRAFHRSLAQSMIDRYDVRGKHIIEVGCGKGEFLTLLCEMGGNTGIGFDPAFVPERNPAQDAARVTFVQDFYSEKYSDYHADVICCKMTLEHIHNVHDFVRTIRDSIGSRRDTLVFFQVPDLGRILQDVAFWDIYYEHCSYFTAESLSRLFESCGFDVLDVQSEYDGQYLQIYAMPGSGSGPSTVAKNDDIVSAARAIEIFHARAQKKIASWGEMLSDWTSAGHPCVLWGSGSKGVAFLSAVPGSEVIEYVVDINPHRHGHYMAGTGQLIVGPEFLREYKPAVVIAMNPVYLSEIGATLKEIGCNARLLSV